MDRLTDRRNDEPTDRRNDGPTDRRTDTPFYRVVCSRLKSALIGLRKFQERRIKTNLGLDFRSRTSNYFLCQRGNVFMNLDLKIILCLIEIAPFVLWASIIWTNVHMSVCTYDEIHLGWFTVWNHVVLVIEKTLSKGFQILGLISM